MRGFLRNYHLEVFLWLLIVAFYLATRLFNLGVIPIFTDEAIYLRWSQIMAHDAGLRFLPLVDGKPPLFMWLVSVVMRLLPGLDSLIAGRLVAVGAGLGALVGMYFAAGQLFRNKTVSFLAVIFYLLSSFTLFYDRFSLADSLLTMWGIWILGLCVVLVRTRRLDVALILGAVLGAAFLTKTPAIFFLPLPVLFLGVFFDWRARGRVWRLVTFFGLYALAVVISQMIFSILRLFPLFHMIAKKNQEFVVTGIEFLANPLGLLSGNLPTLLSWEVATSSLVVVVLLGTAVYRAVRERDLVRLALFGYLAAGVVVIATFNKIIYVRYLLPFAPIIFLLGAAELFSLVVVLGRLRLALSRRVVLCALLFLAVFGQSAYTGFKLLTDPVEAPLLQADRDQYLDGWAAGFGVSEVRDYLAKQSRANLKVTVGTEGTFGLMPYALEIYQKDYLNVAIKPFWPLPRLVPPELEEAAGDHPTFMVIYQQREAPPEWKLEEVLRFRQGRGDDYLRLYKVLPST